MSDNKKLTGTLIPKDNKKAKMHATFYSDKPIGSGGDSEIFDEYIDATDQQRNTALANVSNQTANSTSGKMGYKVLDPTKTFAEQVTAENTIYEIRDAFDLGGTKETPVSVTLPAGSTLKFNGGLIKNCTIVGDKTSIDAANEQIFENVEFSGSFYGALNALWIGAKQKDSTFDNSTILQKYFDDYTSYFNTIKFPEGSYYFKTPVEVSTRFIKIDGDNSIFYTLIDDDLSGNGQTFLTISQETFILDNVRIYNARKTGVYDISKTIAIKCASNSHLFNIKDVTISYFDIAVYLTNVWYGGFSGRTALVGNRIGIFGNPTGGNIEINTIDFNNIRLNSCSKDAAKALYPKNDGESDADWNMRWARCGVDFHCATNGCKFNGMVIEGFDYGIRFNYKAWTRHAGGSGLINIQDCYFEGNQVYDIYVGDGYIIGYNTYKYVFSYMISIKQCLFHTLKKVYLKDCVGTILNSSDPIELRLNQQYNRAYIIHDNSVNNVLHSQKSNERTLSLKDGMNIPDNNGNVYQSTVSQIIKSLEQGVSSLLPNIKNASINDAIDYRYGFTRRIPFISSLTRMPRFIDSHLISADEITYDGSSFKVSTNSGNSKINVSAGNINGSIYNEVSLHEEAIDIEEFIRRWNAGIAYTGYVKQVFGVSVITNPSTGFVYDQDNNIIGFGKKAIDDGITFTVGKYYTNVDTLCKLFYGYGVARFNLDYVQNCRTYGEVLRGIDASAAGYGKVRFICTTTQRDSASLIKHINKIIYNTTDKEYQIWDGTKWNTLSNPWTRYTYKESGKSISERVLIADLSGQTFFNFATGIRYTFYVDLIANTHHWITSIGSVASLEHPNGYDATNNPIEYATELTAGEMVMYNGSIVKWDGTQFVNLDGTPLS